MFTLVTGVDLAFNRAMVSVVRAMDVPYPRFTMRSRVKVSMLELAMDGQPWKGCESTEVLLVLLTQMAPEEVFLTTLVGQWVACLPLAELVADQD